MGYRTRINYTAEQKAEIYAQVTELSVINR